MKEIAVPEKKINCRGRNGWFFLNSVTIGATWVSFYSKRLPKNIAPIVIQAETPKKRAHLKALFKQIYESL